MHSNYLAAEQKCLCEFVSALESAEQLAGKEVNKPTPIGSSLGLLC